MCDTLAIHIKEIQEINLSNKSCLAMLSKFQVIINKLHSLAKIFFLLQGDIKKWL